MRMLFFSSRFCSGLSIPPQRLLQFRPPIRTISAVVECGKNGSRLSSSYNLGPIPPKHQFPARNASALRSSALQFERHYGSTSLQEKKTRKTFIYLAFLAIGMVGASYAAVPLYRTFCQATGYGGTVQRRESVEEKLARHSEDEAMAPTREITIQFNSDVADGMPWKFTPSQRHIKVKVGENALAFYDAENLSSSPITGVASYNVLPMKAGVHFNKVQCFCFEEQRLLPGEHLDFPVHFYIDHEFATDPKMEGINNLTLSYTFFKVAEEEAK